nr:magnesium chelatase subunit H [Chloroflexaceae bacterium]
MLATASGFALVGGMVSSQPEQARAALEPLDVTLLESIPLIFQQAEAWQQDDRGLAPMHLAMNVALTELEGAVEPAVYGGPSGEQGLCVPLPEEIERFAERVARRIRLRRKANSEKKLALVLFSFPPNLGNAGTAAYLDVFASLYRLMQELKADGYHVELPESAEALRRAVVEGNSLIHGTDGNVATHMAVDDYRRLFPHYVEIEPFWGSAPGQLLSDGKRFQILGRQFGNIFVGIQPSFGYERDPMRLLMAKDAAPHHGFAAFYTWIEKVFDADAVVHIGTHGALEFMPGKQAGLSARCWPVRLLGSLPNIYYYCVNNPSEGTIAKRRGAATLVSYMVPPVQQAGLYKGLRLLKDSLENYRQRPSAALLEDIQVQAERLQIADCRLQIDQENEQSSIVTLATDEESEQSSIVNPPALSLSKGQSSIDTYITRLSHELLQIEQRMIPLGLHVLGRPPEQRELVDILALVAAFHRPATGDRRPEPESPATLPELVAAQLGYNYGKLCQELRHSGEAQAAWGRVEQTVKELVSLFVELYAPPVGLKREEHDRLEAQFSALNAQFSVPPALWEFLGDLLTRLNDEQEVAGLLRALRSGYIAPSPGNDVVRNPAVAPTGRNIHGLDPFHIPSAAAQHVGVKLVDELLERLRAEQGGWPETVALVLWGTDNLKTDGEGVMHALALLGAQVVADELGKVADVALIPLAELGRPRIDVVVTASGIFRDLMSHQAMLIDRAVRLAAAAAEPPEQNFVRKHALAQAAELGVSVDEAATRVFSNAPGSYGANVNHLVESSTWEDDGQLSETFMNRKGFALSPGGEWREARPLLERSLATVDATFQNVDSVETGISDVDHYYEYLGGVTKSVEKLRGNRPAVLLGEVEAFAGPGSGRVRSLEQMVRLESRAKLLNPKWFEGMLNHGYEGVHEIELRVSNTYGWSATASAVDGWIYQGVADTYLLDEAMRERLAALNPHAAAGMARRLLEAHSRGFWDADDQTLERLKDIYADLEDRLEGVVQA